MQSLLRFNLNWSYIYFCSWSPWWYQLRQDQLWHSKIQNLILTCVKQNVLPKFWISVLGNMLYPGSWTPWPRTWIPLPRTWPPLPRTWTPLSRKVQKSNLKYGLKIQALYVKQLPKRIIFISLFIQEISE